MTTLIDTNVLLDVLLEDEDWIDWSAAMVADAAQHGRILINPIIYAEVSSAYDDLESLERALPAQFYTREALPWEAAFLAGRAFVGYRRRGGSRRSPLPDFYIGAHAAVGGYTLLTRDPARYRSYFPKLRIVAP
ncbi:MAG TPA: type II toxin-antitoxin system VapC family toxin [Vicinamibacterales bacterium]|nr:type II toxin-antitoxin system VapC family toxin [Vicinamibacterales bacterium]